MSPAKPTKAALKAKAEKAGLRLLEKGKGFALVDAETGTFVADRWLEPEGLTLAEIEEALKG